jgi:UDP-2-acetamido-3-amino-2,3-dideoxy-glucuronate N-acetyltransferase
MTEKNYFVHPTSVVGDPVEIGEKTQVWHFCHVMAGARIGANCVIGQNAFIARGAILGNQVKIQNNVSVFDGVVLEDDVFCGPSVVFTNVFNPRSFISRRKEFRKTLIKKGATIGANATVICGNTIGSYAFIGAGAVVTRDIPDYALVIGNPGRVKGYVCQCAVPLIFQGENAECRECGKAYEKDEAGVRPVHPPGPA